MKAESIGHSVMEEWERGKDQTTEDGGQTTERERERRGGEGRFGKKGVKSTGEGEIATRRRPKRTGLPSSPWLRRGKMARQVCGRRNKKEMRLEGDWGMG
jgi:hypothetical protein